MQFLGSTLCIVDMEYVRKLLRDESLTFSMRTSFSPSNQACIMNLSVPGLLEQLPLSASRQLTREENF